ncbi:sensor histidine kinase [Pengzhenrongella frigida]|uniref:Oxygen sensor histidine kinase NreB n=2 Tax=Pengzhenrongella frigida TaxID=1259133 RepID=A0A4Q5N3H7_9MICO|nr:sensor histidine kinase [Cellulomonas sp. HLT2-17]
MAGLISIAVLQADPTVSPWATVLAGGAFGAWYAWGRATIRVLEAPITTPRGAWWPAGAWITGLALLWVVLLVTSTAALWIAFPMMLLQMHVLGPHRGVLAVSATTLLAVGTGLLERAGTDASIGFVLGPVVGAAVAVAVVLGFEALARESEERQRTVEELTEVREHLAAAERDAAVAGERERLAREIHDTLAQGFSAIELLLRAADAGIGVDDTRARGYLDQARRTALDNLGEARRFVRALAPADLDGATLVAALERVARRAQDTAASDGTPEALVVRVQTAGPRRALPIALEAALVRVAQSALANVVQHAGARNAAVTLAFLDDEVILDVVDDGRGFDPDRQPDRSHPGGFGLVAMSSRAHELGGTLAVETAPGDGTAVAVRLPTSDPSGSGRTAPFTADDLQEAR